MRTVSRWTRLVAGMAVLPGVLFAPGSTTVALAQDSAATELSIELASDTPLERRGRDQLQRLLRTYDLRPWLFTRRVRIESYVIPHSHPVLTLNTRYLDNDTAQVATLLHEQLHLLVCLLELDSVARVFDQSAARRTLQGWQHYTWVYREVLARPEPIQRVLRNRGLTLPAEPG